MFLHTIDVPGIGPVDASGSLIYAFWDLQNNHASFIADPTDNSYPVYINDQVPKGYLDIAALFNARGAEPDYALIVITSGEVLRSISSAVR